MTKNCNGDKFPQLCWHLVLLSFTIWLTNDLFSLLKAMKCNQRQLIYYLLSCVAQTSSKWVIYNCFYCKNLLIYRHFQSFRPVARKVAQWVAIYQKMTGRPVNFGTTMLFLFLLYLVYFLFQYYFYSLIVQDYYFEEF